MIIEGEEMNINFCYTNQIKLVMSKCGYIGGIYNFDIVQPNVLLNNIIFFDYKDSEQTLKLCAKIYTDNSGLIQYNNEREFLKKYYNNDNINIPKLYCAQVVDNLPLIIMQRISGIALSYQIKSGLHDDVFKVFLQVFSNLKSLDYTIWMDYMKLNKLNVEKLNTLKMVMLKNKINRYAHHLQPYYGLLNEQKKYVKWYNISIIHHDLSINNIIIDNFKKIYVIDWTSVGIFDTRYEFADAYLKYEFLADGYRKKELLIKYCNDNLYDINEIEYFYLLNILEKIVEYYSGAVSLPSAKIKWYNFLLFSLEKSLVQFDV